MGKQKLTNTQIAEIRRLYRPSVGGNESGAQYHQKFEGSMSWLAERFGVSAAAIHAVVHGRRKETKTTLERFMAFVQKTDNGCWLWTGNLDLDGYGGFYVAGRQKAHHMAAHRASWILHRGPIPPNQWVLHTCDTPPCVNPDHLFLGAHKDNIADKMAKGRNRRTLSILTEYQVKEIRNAYVPRPTGRPKGKKQRSGNEPGSVRFLAEKYGVSRAAIKKIIRRITWKTVQ